MSENKIKTFVQEGIGALLAYLPSETAVATLQDFIDILDRPKPVPVAAPKPTRTEELKLPPVPAPKPQKKESPLIEYTG